MIATLISVVIPAWNCRKYIAATLDSALAQSHADLEVVVVDDASPDDSAAIVQEYARRDARVRYVRHERNLGVAQARNTGVREARGEYVAFLDSDDLWHPDKLRRQMAVIAGEDCSLCFTGWTMIAEDGSDLGNRQHIPERVDYPRLLKGNVINSSTVLARRDVFLRFPMDRSDLHEDYLEWLTILKNLGPARGIDEPLAVYRLIPGSRSHDKRRAALNTWRTLRQQRLGLVRTCWYFAHYALHGLRRYWRIKLGLG